MKALRHLLSAIIVILLTYMAAEAQFVGPAPLVVPGNTYAFQYSPPGTIGGLTPFGLYFQAGTGTPGYEFRGTAGAKLATFQSIPSGQREPGDLTFGSTGSLIVNPNRYAFRFSLTKEYGLFFNAADRYYQFLNGVDQGGDVGSPIFSVQADSGNTGINILPNPNDKLIALRESGSYGPGKSAIHGFRVGSPGNPTNGGTSWSPSGVDAAVKGFSDWGNQFSAAVYGFGVLDYPNSATIMGFHSSLDWGSIGYRDSNQVWAGYFNGDLNVTGNLTGTSPAVLGGPLYSVEAGGPTRVNYTRVSASPYAWPRTNIIADNLNYGIFPGLALVARSDSAAGGILFGTSAGGFNAGAADGAGFVPINASAFNVSSDRTVKKDITSITPENSARYMEYIRNIESATFRYKSEDEQSRPYEHIGVIAQTVPKEIQAEIFASSGGGSQEKKLGVSLADMQGLILIGLKAMDQNQQDLIEENEELKEQVQQLSEMMARMDESMSQCCLNHNSKSQHEPFTNTKDESWLGQNVPNPFDNSTVIRYYTPESVSAAQIQVADLKGQVIKSFRLEKGYGEVKFDVSGISSGTYIYTLINDDSIVATKRMILN